MFRLFCVTAFLAASLFACKGGYESCKQKIIDSQTIVQGSLYIPINKTQRLVFSKKTPNATIIKQSPLLQLYLTEDTKSFPYPFQMNINVASGYAAINAECAQEGIVTSQQIGLNQLAYFNETTSTPSLLLNSCCSFEGIVTDKGIITKEYIQEFLDSKNTDYGDIGIRVEDQNGSVAVKYVDPFVYQNPLEVGDLIVEVDGIGVKSIANFMKYILFSKPLTTHALKVRRGEKFLDINVTTKKRYGGGFLSDTFLEQKGIFFDKELHITKLMSNNAYNGLHIGDRLISVNGVNVTNEQDVMKNIPHFMKFAILLFQRDDFQFFIRVN